jgi:ankyrin repeat protein
LDQIVKGNVQFDLNLVEEADSVGTVLHHAVLLSNMAANTRLLSRRARHISNGEEIMPIHKVRIVENLIDYGKAEINIVNKLGETPLHMCRNIEVARVLLDKGAIMNICEITGKMPLFTYILSAHYDMCVEMLKNGCDLENIDRLGNSLFQVLIKSNAPLKLILLLLEAGFAFEKEEWVKNKQYTQVLVEKYPKLVDLIDYKLKNPPSLKEIARKSLRIHLNKINNNKSIVSSVLKLNKILPAALQDYILLKSNKHLLIK